MPVVNELDLNLAKELTKLRFSKKMNQRMQWLMDRSSEGVITKDQMNEMEALADLSETMSLFKAQALQFLNQMPKRR